jgi:hypothetical protein
MSIVTNIICCRHHISMSRDFRWCCRGKYCSPVSPVSHWFDKIFHLLSQPDSNLRTHQTFPRKRIFTTIFNIRSN